MAEIVIVRDKQAAGALVADHIAGLIRSNPETVLGLATGSTPLPVYEALRSRLEGVDVSGVRTVLRTLVELTPFLAVWRAYR